MNLLTDPLIRVETPGGVLRVSLPDLLEALGQDTVCGYPGIQRHQEDAFHVFLCYLGAAVLSRGGQVDPHQTRDYWVEGLRALAPEAPDAAWTLVVDNPAEPAFMQPPLPHRDHGKLTLKASTPDALDVLVTAKNHDIKMQRAVGADVDEWVFSLVSVQTMSGFLGRGNYGISRMNSGDGSRLLMEVVRTLDPGLRWSDAVTRLLRHRQHLLLNSDYGYDPQGLVLVWLEPWDGIASLPLNNLDPCYIEICRRLRLRASPDGEAIVRADAVPSEGPRISAKALNGVVGDPWAPVDLAKTDRAGGQKALTIGPAGLTPDTLRRLVLGDQVGLSGLQVPEPGWTGDLWLTLSVLVRGQGVTEGFHEFRLKVPPHVQPRMFGKPAIHDPWVLLSKQLISAAGSMYQAVNRAIRTYLEGCPAEGKPRKVVETWSDRWKTRFESLWMDEYFQFLWGTADDFEPEAIQAMWARALWKVAQMTLGEAMAAMPQHSGRRYYSRVGARRTLWANAVRSFPSLRPSNLDTSVDTSVDTSEERNSDDEQFPNAPQDLAASSPD